jgi:cytochrome c oxidase subunit IV
MLTEERHVTGYFTYALVLTGLLVLTAVTILVPALHFTAMAVLVALLIASTKAGIVITWFMHLKLEGPLFKTLVIMVLLIYGFVIVLTFADYMTR